MAKKLQVMGAFGDGPGGNVEIPETLPNPHPLTFTGAVEASYDGSKEVTVEIPQGGGASEWELIDTFTTNPDTLLYEYDVTNFERVVLVPLSNVEGTSFYLRINGNKMQLASSGTLKTANVPIYCRYLADDTVLYSYGRTDALVYEHFVTNLPSTKTIGIAATAITSEVDYQLWGMKK